MGKIGDLWVRLGLKSDDYKKGMDKAKKETTSFGASLGKMKAGALAVWAAIGTAVIGFGKKMIETTNGVGDAWNRFTAKMNAAWSTFVQAVSTADFSNLIRRIKDATAAAEELQNALDLEFEASNSIKLQKAAMADELAELEVLARNQTKSYKERAAAAKKYLEMVKPLYDQELNLAKKLEDAHIGKWISNSSLKDNEQTRRELRRFLVEYGKNEQLMNMLGVAVKANSRDVFGGLYIEKARSRQNLPGGEKYKAFIAEYNTAIEWIAEYRKNMGFSNSLIDMAYVYEKMRGDVDTAPLVDAMIAAGQAEGAFLRETKRMQMALNTNEALLNKELNGADGAEDKIQRKELNPIAAVNFAPPSVQVEQLNPPEIFTDEWMAEQKAKGEEFFAWYQEELARIDELNGMLSDAIVQSLSGGMQALTDMMFGLEGADPSQLLSALMQPFADTATQLGEMLLAQGIAVEAFKTSLESLKGAPAIAAGLSLIALGAAMKSGIQALANGSAGSGSTASYGGSSYGSSTAQNYESTLTVYVEGRISGNDIVISGSKTQNSLGR